jgi:hypothetical protein
MRKAMLPPRAIDVTESWESPRSLIRGASLSEALAIACGGEREASAHRETIPAPSADALSAPPRSFRRPVAVGVPPRSRRSPCAARRPTLRMSWEAPTFDAIVPGEDNEVTPQPPPAPRCPTVPCGAVDDAEWNDALIRALHQCDDDESASLQEPEVRTRPTMPVASCTRITWLDAILAGLRAV